MPTNLSGREMGARGFVFLCNEQAIINFLKCYGFQKAQSKTMDPDPLITTWVLLRPINLILG